MENLFLKNNEETRILSSEEFKTEESIEKMIFNTPKLLEDIFLIRRQVRAGKKAGILDIVGIDKKNGNICIIEIKNTTVDKSIILQVLNYARWAEKNPDSIRALWLEREDRPNISIKWNDCKVRILIIAPSFLKSDLDVVNQVRYEIDFIEVKRWRDGENQFLLLHSLEDEESPGTKTVTGLETHDDEFYLDHYNKQSAQAFLEYTKEIDSFVGGKGWPLILKYNKDYSVFQAGSSNVFGIEFVGTKKIQIFVKISEEQARELPIKISGYSKKYKDAEFVLEPGKTTIQDYYPVLEQAYKNIKR